MVQTKTDKLLELLSNATGERVEISVSFKGGFVSTYCVYNTMTRMSLTTDTIFLNTKEGADFHFELDGIKEITFNCPESLATIFIEYDDESSISFFL